MLICRIREGAPHSIEVSRTSTQISPVYYSLITQVQFNLISAKETVMHAAAKEGNIKVFPAFAYSHQVGIVYDRIEEFRKCSYSRIDTQKYWRDCEKSTDGHFFM